MLEEGLDQHRLLFGAVEGLDHDVDPGEELGDILRRQAAVEDGDLHVGIDPRQVRAQRLDLGQADLVDEVLLAVEVGGLDDVEVGDDELADAAAGEGDGDARTEAAGAGDADDGALEPGVDAGGVAGDEQGFELFGRGMFAAADQHQAVPLLQRSVPPPGGSR